MEQEQPNSGQLDLLIDSLPSSTIYIVLSFLDDDTIISIVSASNGQKDKGGRMMSIARNLDYIKKYINKTDRSAYMPFYSEQNFAKIEFQQLSYMTTVSNELKNLSFSWEKLVRILKSELVGFQQGDQVLDSLFQSLTDPEFPFPKLRKQNVGMHCNSAFQFFLLEKLISNSKDDRIDEVFQTLTYFINQRWNLIAFNEHLKMQKIKYVFSTGFNINYQNYRSYLLQGNVLHNFIVLILALLDLIVYSYSFYVGSIQDPFYSFVEFNMRFSIYRNILLSLEDKLGFIFKNYSNFCREIFNVKSQMEAENNWSQEFRQMTIWHCGLSKWYIYMQHHHQQHFQVFFYLLKKTNFSTIIQNNFDRLDEHHTFIQLHNRLQFCELSFLERQTVLKGHSPIEDIFNGNPELYSQLIKEYIEYLVDISINEYSVHWCGHSQHVMHVPYQQFEALLVENIKVYIDKIEKITDLISDPAKAFDTVMRSMIEQLDREYLKPVTLKKIVDIVNSKIRNAVDSLNNKYRQFEMVNKIAEIYEDILNRDNMLTHFNTNAGISNEINYKYSIALENEEFLKSLKTSASTNASDIQTENPSKLQFLQRSQSIIQDDFP